ncbi:efflux RND transporter periplasmic adaptor subunit [Flammeovirgaceae bacterium SG7u.111]|nr:efflux RND transporter periplasmic adaptor subunit [Flammeovirgaceae bacterium SG7u.132]WPO38687.1 efflux RND transporter periplasmic adaptor subunit [Flammeovirgaceae bacterium SG7u.111]
MKKLFENKILLVGIALFVGVVIGWVIKSSNNSIIKPSSHHHIIEPSNHQEWTCSMHPQIRKNEPGDCPICGMDLIPLESETDVEVDPMAVSMSATAMQLAQVQTMVVGYGDTEKAVRLNGKVQADERKVFTQSSHIPGRIEQLTANFTGDYVKEGQAIAYIYSPELVNAQEELFEAQKIKDTQPGLFNAAKEKLKNWKLTDVQIDQILSSGKAKSKFPVLANVSGYVSKKLVNLGDYIKLGQPIYEIMDLSKVWVLFEVYESDLSWIKKGDKVSYTVQSLTSETFEGEITYIDPSIDPVTRVAKARVEVVNKELKLKPEMFASGIVSSEVGGKEQQVVVPKSAVMWTGKRSVVYVKNTTSQGVSFLLREVSLGATLGEGFVIEKGLQLGEEVAVNGTFSIDAAAQLAGKPSMMSLEEKVDVGEDAKTALLPLFRSYFELKKALAADDFGKAKEAGGTMKVELVNVDMKLFEGDAHKLWMEQADQLKKGLVHVSHFNEIDELRKVFMPISNAMIVLAESFQPLSETVYVQRCPMADNDRGADWLSLEKEILNPYFGDMMLNCGEVKKVIH